jgi:hypothetical protein
MLHTKLLSYLLSSEVTFVINVSPQKGDMTIKYLGYNFDM